jgi:hypothetical protein
MAVACRQGALYKLLIAGGVHECCDETSGAHTIVVLICVLFDTSNKLVTKSCRDPSDVLA